MVIAMPGIHSRAFVNPECPSVFRVNKNPLQLFFSELLQQRSPSFMRALQNVKGGQQICRFCIGQLCPALLKKGLYGLSAWSVGGLQQGYRQLSESGFSG